jgi:hypothetical protein
MKTKAILHYGLLALLLVCSASAQDVKQRLTNDDVIHMVQAGFADDTILNVIHSQDSRFDVSVDGLLALKKAGTSEKVINAMVAAASGKQNAPASSSAQPSGQAQTPPPPPGAANMQAMLAQMGIQMPPQAAAMMGMGAGGAGYESFKMPRVSYYEGQSEPTEMRLSTAEVVQTKGNFSGGSDGTKLIESLAQEGLQFAAVAAGPGAMIGMSMASSVMPMMHGTPKITHIWALPGRRSETVYTTPNPKVELNFEDLVGIDPEDYQPAIVHLLQTKDNWRLVGAAKIKVTEMEGMYGGGMPEAISEIRMPVRLEKISAGQYDIEPSQPLPPGEYGVVLHRLNNKRRKGTLGGGAEKTVFYSVWDFSIADPNAKPAPGKAR